MNLLDEFEQFRQAIAIDEPLLELDPNGIPDLGTQATPDLFSIVSEWNALRHEIKQQNVLQQQTARSLDDTLTAVAELRRRLEQEQREATEKNQQAQDQLRTELQRRSQQQLRDMMLSLLPALDSLDFAIQHWEQSNSEYQQESAPLIGRWHYQTLGRIMVSGTDGLQGIRRRFLQWLAESGVEPIDAVGKRFDASVMMAIGTHAVNAGELRNHVHTESLRGYTLNGQLLRVAEVVVAV